MKKIILSILLLSILFATGLSQSVAINTDGSTADASAIMDIKNNNKGILVPRMSKAERNSIINPATGLLVYQLSPDSVGFYYYDGAAWDWIEKRRTKIDTLTYNVSINFPGGTYTNPVSILDKGPYVGIYPNTSGVDDHYELPNPALFVGRTYYVRNNNNSVTAYLKPNSSLICPGSGNCLTAGATFVMPGTGSGKTVLCISDGVNWTVIKQD
jgi:hypothetical protein